MLRTHRLAAFRALTTAIALIALAAPAAAVEEDGGLWLGVVLSAPIVEDVSASVLVQTRMHDEFSQLERVLIRPGLSWKLGDHWALGAGYDAHLIRNPRRVEEHRAYQEVLLATPWSWLGLQQRARLEQRVLDGVDGASVRLRYRLRATAPLFDTQFQTIVSNEVFLNINSLRRGPDSGFGEDRVFAGVSRRLSKHVVAEGGYQLQWVERTRGDLANHIAVLQLTFAP